MPSDSESAVHRGEEEHHQRQQQQRRTLAATADDRNDADDGLIGGTFLWATRSGALFTCKSSALCVCAQSTLVVEGAILAEGDLSLYLLE